MSSSNDPFADMDVAAVLDPDPPEEVGEGEEVSETGELALQLRDLAAQLYELLEDVKALDVKGLEPEEIVDLGQVLWDLSTKNSKALDPIKAALRKVAKERWGTDPGPRYFIGYQGSECVVTVPNPSLKVRPGADMERLRQQVGDISFRDHFDIAYKPRKSFRDRVASCSDQTRRRDLLAVVDEMEGTPRVSFKVL